MRSGGALGRPDLEEFAASALRGARGARRGIEVDLSALSERARLEILYAFQQIWLDGGYAWVGTRRLQGVVDAARARGARLAAGRVGDRGQAAGACLPAAARRGRASAGRPGARAWQDVWRLGVLRPDGVGRRSTTRAITQPWLRELVKQWNRQRLVSRSVGTLRLDVHVALELSNVLRLRGGRGEDPSVLGRQDAVDFLVHLRAPRSCGARSATTITAAVSRGSGRCCARRASGGFTGEPGPLAGLADEFAFYDGDVPRAARRDPEGEPERALPQAVIDQLLAPERARAAARDAPARRWRARSSCRCAPAAGRRRSPTPRSNVLSTSSACARTASSSRLPVFVYRPEKRPKTRKELPIFAEERRLIRRMQCAGARAVPRRRPDRLPLLPRQMRNRHGPPAAPPGTLAVKMREWVEGLGELTGPDGESFDRAKVFPYAFRHSYAQRLADEGASESELMDLMDHDSFETTRGYFRIRAERRRRAAELGRKALFDNQGRRLMRGLEQLAEAERVTDGAGVAGGPLRRVRGAGERRLDGRRVQVHAQVPGLQALPHRPLAPAGARGLRAPAASPPASGCSAEAEVGRA